MIFFSVTFPKKAEKNMLSFWKTVEKINFFLLVLEKREFFHYRFPEIQ